MNIFEPYSSMNTDELIDISVSRAKSLKTQAIIGEVIFLVAALMVMLIQLSLITIKSFYGPMVLTAMVGAAISIRGYLLQQVVTSNVTNLLLAQITDGTASNNVMNDDSVEDEREIS